MSLNSHGRIEIYTDERNITSENVIAVLRDGYNKHLTNYQDIDYLIRFEAGEEPHNLRVALQLVAQGVEDGGRTLEPFL